MSRWLSSLQMNYGTAIATGQLVCQTKLPCLFYKTCAHWLCYTPSQRLSLPPHFFLALQMTSSRAQDVAHPCYLLIQVSKGIKQQWGEALLLIFPQKVPILEILLPCYQYPCEINYTRICACQEKQTALAKNVITNAVSQPPILEKKPCPAVTSKRCAMAPSEQ